MDTSAPNGGSEGGLPRRGRFQFSLRHLHPNRVGIPALVRARPRESDDIHQAAPQGFALIRTSRASVRQSAGLSTLIATQNGAQAVLLDT
jgi:hypothetical protein